MAAHAAADEGPHAGKTPSRFYQRTKAFAPLSNRLFGLALQAFPRLRTDHDLHRADQLRTEAPIGSIGDLPGQESGLRAPRTGACGDHQHPPFQADGGRLGGQARTDHGLPIGGQAADGKPSGECPFAKEPVHHLPDGRVLQGPLVSAATPPLARGHPHTPSRTVAAPADTSQTASALGGTWASSATVTTTWPRPASRSATWPPRFGSRAENGSSRSRTGGSPTSPWMALPKPRRRHSAAAQASPWEAKARAPRSRTASSRSSRCWPTRLVRRVSSSFLRSARRVRNASSRSSPHTEGRYSQASPVPDRPANSSWAPGDSRATASARRRRSADPFATSSASQASRSSGPKNAARTCRRRSRLRRTGDRLTWTLFAPCPGISTSTSTRPPAVSISPRR